MQTAENTNLGKFGETAEVEELTRQTVTWLSPYMVIIEVISLFKTLPKHNKQVSDKSRAQHCAIFTGKINGTVNIQ